MTVHRLSAPLRRTALPRPLSEGEQAVFGRVADTLCPGEDGLGPPTSQIGFDAALEVAVATRSDAFELIIRLLAAAAAQSHLEGWLRRLHDEDAVAFGVLSTVAAGAYLLLPPVRQHLGYPGQERSVPSVDQAADELADGILDPVLERGHFYTDPTAVTITPGGARQSGSGPARATPDSS